VDDQTARDQLHTIISALVFDRDDARMAADALYALGWRPPAQVVETAEELDALPEGTVVRDAEGYVVERNADGYGSMAGGATEWWAALPLPATVLWDPTNASPPE